MRFSKQSFPILAALIALALPCRAGAQTRPAAKSRDAALQEAIDAKDLAGIKASWTTGYDFNPLRPKVAVALFDLDKEELANMLLASNCFLGCEDLKAIDAAYGTEKVVPALKTLLSTHAFAQPGDNIIAKKVGAYLIEHDAFKADTCASYVKIADKDGMTLGPLQELGEAKCVVPKKTLVHFLTSDDADERSLAAWVAGESKAKSVSELLRKLSTTDGAFNQQTHEYYVRAAAANALNKIKNR
jgi:hypothetical protein